MKVALVHPLKHHAYYSLEGVIQHCEESKAFFGYYNCGDWIDRLLALTPFKSLIDGYSHQPIDNNVITSKWIKVLFLLHKFAPKYFAGFYNKQFQKWVIRHLDEYDCIHVLSDFCNDVIRAAYKKNLKIVYEQILAFNHQQYYMDADDISDSEKIRVKHATDNLKMADVLIAPSEFVCESIPVPIKKYLFPYGVDVEKFHFYERPYDGTEPLKILCAAGISDRKGIPFLLEAMKRLSNDNVLLTYCGKPADESGNQLLELMEHCENIRYISFVPHEQIGELFHKHDVYILPSLAEGSSLSVYEAMATGMACIVTKNTGTVIQDQFDGFIVPIRDSEAIEHAIRSFLERPELVQTMGKEARLKAQYYTWAHFSEQVSKVYEDLDCCRDTDE